MAGERLRPPPPSEGGTEHIDPPSPSLVEETESLLHVDDPPRYDDIERESNLEQPRSLSEFTQSLYRGDQTQRGSSQNTTHGFDLARKALSSDIYDLERNSEARGLEAYNTAIEAIKPLEIWFNNCKEAYEKVFDHFDFTQKSLKSVYYRQAQAELLRFPDIIRRVSDQITIDDQPLMQIARDMLSPIVQESSRDENAIPPAYFDDPHDIPPTYASHLDEGRFESSLTDLVEQIDLRLKNSIGEIEVAQAGMAAVKANTRGFFRPLSVAGKQSDLEKKLNVVLHKREVLQTLPQELDNLKSGLRSLQSRVTGLQSQLERSNE
jgi:hypothetical protein